ncbi:hypothetical protein Sste5344_006989 [Sporothrix stenoceras]
MAGISKDGSGKLGRQWVWNRTLTDDIPSLPIVRGLFVTLRFYRVISHKFLASVIVKKLPNLWDIRIEQWTWLDLKGVALQMPKLRIMELWNAKKPYIFRYEVTPEQARIIVLAPFRARPEIESEWELASHHHDHLKNKPLVIKYENLDVVGVNELATRGADIFGHLRLADEILDPRSQFQLHCRNISRARFRELNGDNDEAGETDYDDDEADGEGE